MFLEVFNYQLNYYIWITKCKPHFLLHLLGGIKFSCFESITSHIHECTRKMVKICKFQAPMKSFVLLNQCDGPSRGVVTYDSYVLPLFCRSWNLPVEAAFKVCCFAVTMTVLSLINEKSKRKMSAYTVIFPFWKLKTI